MASIIPLRVLFDLLFAAHAVIALFSWRRMDLKWQRWRRCVLKHDSIYWYGAEAIALMYNNVKGANGHFTFDSIVHELKVSLLLVLSSAYVIILSL